MYKLLKHIMLLSAAISFLFCFTAKAEWTEPFGNVFAEQFQLSNLPNNSDCGKQTTQELQNIIGAFLYENLNNSLYYIDASHLYESSNGKPFTMIDSNVPWASLQIPNEILIMSNRVFIVNSMWMYK